MRKQDSGMGMPLRLTVILSGTLLLAFTYYHINYQNHLTEGGFVGLSLLGKYVLGISPSLTILILDIPVLLIAMIFKGRAFVLNTFISVGAFTVFYSLMERYSGWVINLQDNLPLAALLSGVLTGLGAGMVLRGGGASGGDDILSLLISEWKGIKVGTVFILMDVIVLALSLFYMPLKETLYTVMAVVVAGYVITFTTSLGRPKLGKAPTIQPTLSKPHDGTVM
ncbi:YitT family protein [Paenibacillus sonchi]|uniref:YitT family protein n=1 Tax=Paenibacillus sonchi TaxID=373687 RepID=A0A974SD72_9BACL|nr:YitT family protein [Paenibacillus sonchi]MCE3202196.1 YitT family protein [Paenibacillus sonchi]QQZ60926.1 YitT family protein [Paenibacillus sonchi]